LFWHPEGSNEIQLWYDESALCLGWTCQDTDLQAALTERDSPLWQGDVVECFLTREDLARYFEFECNPLNAVFDGIVTNELDAKGVSIQFQADTRYTAKTMQSAGKRTP
jgi:hypothetical protein